MLLVPFYTSCKHQKISDFLMLLEVIKRDQWHDVVYYEHNTKIKYNQNSKKNHVKDSYICEVLHNKVRNYVEASTHSL